MYDIKYELIGENHVNEAADLVMAAYNEERNQIPFLPEAQDFANSLRQSISRLFGKGIGIAALLDGKLIGFIAALEIKDLWGKCKGVYSPLYGHGAIKEHRSRLYQEMYRRAADMWVQNHITSHALTFFAHDRETIDTWFWLGFGNRCVDSIRQTAAIEAISPDIIIKKVELEDVAGLAEVEKQLHMYFNNSPMFMPRQEEDPIEEMTKWLKEDNRHMWAAYKEGKAVGHMRIQDDGETFISQHPSIMNITGAYVLDSERKSGVAAMLLDAIQKWQSQNGYHLCGVDFESFNTAGSGFWNKYFIPYTHTMTRRIDERIND